MILMSHPLGNANVRQAALALEEAGLLAEFWTGFHWVGGGMMERLLPGVVRRELARRSFPAPIRPRVRVSPARELGRLLASRLPGGLGGWLTRHETGPYSVDAVFRALDRRTARRLAHLPGLRGVYAYEDGAAGTFAAAAKLGLRRIYDLPIGYWRAGHAIYEEEAQREPVWAPTLTGRDDSPEKLARKDEELALAEVVIVASSFTRQTLDAAPRRPAVVHVIPYGAPSPAAVDDAPLSAGDDGRGARKLRVLFAGSLGQRKGLSYLLEAVRRLAGHVELTLLGAKTVAGCAPLEEAVRAHRWIPSLPHGEVLAEMSRQDVLVFPSLFEGFGLVILEAMSRGLPVIATPHTAGPDVIADGEDGFIVPIRSADAIEEKLEILIRDPARLAAMKAAAREKAASITWENYRRRLVEAVKPILE
jgi:starch synthase